MRGTDGRVVSLAANPPLFPCRAEQTLCKIETLLRFYELLLKILDATLNCLEPRNKLIRW